jgi:hypothetical protein
MGIVALPTAEASLRVKPLIGISQLACIGRCSLRVAFGASVSRVPRLPDTPSARLGTILHKLLELSASGRIERSGSAIADSRTTLGRLMMEAGEDIFQSIPPHQMEQRKALAIAAAATLLEKTGVPAASRTRGRSRPLRFESLSDRGFWSEVPIESPSLRLRGRMDYVQKRWPNVMVTDNKTGRVAGRDGTLMKHIQLQLHLYGLVIRERLPDWTISLLVKRDREWHVQFGAAEESATRQWLERTLARFPAWTELSSTSLASVGAGCRSCPFRHVCMAYLQIAPEFWKNGSSLGPLPNDIWGTIQRVREVDGLVDLDIVDAGNRRARVTGLSSKWRLRDRFAEGKPVYFFGLSADPPAFHQGVWRHPINFHEIPRSRRGHPAEALAVFTHERAGEWPETRTSP